MSFQSTFFWKTSRILRYCSMVLVSGMNVSTDKQIDFAIQKQVGRTAGRIRIWDQRVLADTNTIWHPKSSHALLPDSTQIIKTKRKDRELYRKQQDPNRMDDERHTNRRVWSAITIAILGGGRRRGYQEVDGAWEVYFEAVQISPGYCAANW